MINNIPNFLYNLLIEQYGKEVTNKIINGYSKKRNTTLRVNTLKTSINYVKEYLTKLNYTYSEVPWYESALILENVTEKEIKDLKIYENGEIYLQSLSSMIPAIILNPKEDENILDMAAAPGGKTTQMVALSKNNAYITACEKNKIRAERLKYNIEKQGATRVSVMVKDSRELDNFLSFDKILLDAPCSGSGTLDINDSKLETIFTEKLLNRSIKFQTQLLNKAINLLKRGSEMVYSTCSILEKENEMVLQEIINKNKIEIVPIKKELFPDVPFLNTKINGTLCVCPTDLYEGFFVAKIIKK